jgi:hypothetical protein
VAVFVNGLELLHTHADTTLIYREKRSQRIAVLRPITPRLVYRLV